MRKLEGINKKKYDILILSKINIEWLKYCLPKKFSIFAFEFSNRLNYVKSLSFFVKLLIYILRHGITSISLFSAIISEIKPKVVITYIDNNKFMGPLQTIFPNILFISVQNSMRWPDYTYNPVKGYFNFPHYFGFGDRELELMKTSNATVKKYYSVGSLKMGIFLSYFYNSRKKHSYGNYILFISGFGSRLVNSSDPEFVELRMITKKICRNLIKFKKENNVNIVIEMRSDFNDDNYLDEKKYFENIFGHNEVILNTNQKDLLSSYQTGMDASLIVSIRSALMYELLGLEKKILCIDYFRDMEVFNKRLKTKHEYFSSKYSNPKPLPDEIFLNTLEYDQFQKKAKALLNMNKITYSTKTKFARKFYMNFKDEHPHNIIYKIINQRCKNET